MRPHRTESAGSASVSLRGLRTRRQGGGMVQGSGLGRQACGPVRHAVGHQAWRMGKETTLIKCR